MSQRFLAHQSSIPDRFQNVTLPEDVPFSGRDSTLLTGFFSFLSSHSRGWMVPEVEGFLPLTAPKWAMLSEGGWDSQKIRTRKTFFCIFFF